MGKESRRKLKEMSQKRQFARGEEIKNKFMQMRLLSYKFPLLKLPKNHPSLVNGKQPLGEIANNIFGVPSPNNLQTLIGLKIILEPNGDDSYSPYWMVETCLHSLSSQDLVPLAKWSHNHKLQCIMFMHNILDGCGIMADKTEIESTETLQWIVPLSDNDMKELGNDYVIRRVINEGKDG